MTGFLSKNGKSDPRKLPERERTALFYGRMALIRAFEEHVSSLFSEGLLAGTTHACIGQEAVAVGVVSALRDDDVVFSNHRGHGHYIAYTGECATLLAEITGSPNGVCNGFGGSQHLHTGNFYSNGIQGGIVPVATGMALAERMKGTGALAAVFLGDGTLGQGVVYEAFNMAALWNAPILFVVENNAYAMSTPVAQGVAGSIEARAEAFSIPAQRMEGNDVDRVFEKTCELTAAIRENPAPRMLVLDTYRHCGHSKSDDCSYRPDGELEAWLARDPLATAAASLDKTCVADLDRRVNEMIGQAVEYASMAAADMNG